MGPRRALPQRRSACAPVPACGCVFAFKCLRVAACSLSSACVWLRVRFQVPACGCVPFIPVMPVFMPVFMPVHACCMFMPVACSSLCLSLSVWVPGCLGERNVRVTYHVWVHPSHLSVWVSARHPDISELRGIAMELRGTLKRTVPGRHPVGVCQTLCD